MRNHFHLYLQTPEGNLSRFMQALLTSFTSIRNHRQNTSGHLFQGRYKSLIVEDASFGMALFSDLLSGKIFIERIRKNDEP